MKDAMKDAPRRSSIADEKRSVSFLVIDLARRPGIMGNGIFDVIRDVATKKGEIVLTTDSTHSPDAKKSSFLPQLFFGGSVRVHWCYYYYAPICLLFNRHPFPSQRRAIER
jgi:hypothetical protein